MRTFVLCVVTYFRVYVRVHALVALFLLALKVVDADETCTDGAAQDDMGECRMDMVDSELGYLGYDSTEAYGLTWKVTFTLSKDSCTGGACSLSARKHALL